MNILPFALAAIRRGWCIFPCHANAKTPAVKSWGAESSNDEKQVREWFSTATNLNYGIAALASGLVIVDCDVAKDGYEFPSEWQDTGIRCGDDALAMLMMQLGGDVSYLDTFTVETPSGGVHYYYKAPATEPVVTNSASRIAPLVDIRAAGGEFGGYVVGGGSEIDGRPYRVTNKAAILQLPEQLHQAATAQPRSSASPHGAAGGGSSSVSGFLGGSGGRFAGAAEWLRGVMPGQQSAGLYWAACVAKADGVPPQECYDVLWPIMAALPCSREPWEEHHVISHIKSAYSQERT